MNLRATGTNKYSKNKEKWKLITFKCPGWFSGCPNTTKEQYYQTLRSYWKNLLKFLWLAAVTRRVLQNSAKWNQNFGQNAARSFGTPSDPICQARTQCKYLSGPCNWRIWTNGAFQSTMNL